MQHKKYLNVFSYFEMIELRRFVDFAKKKWLIEASNRFMKHTYLHQSVIRSLG